MCSTASPYRLCQPALPSSHKAQPYRCGMSSPLVRHLMANDVHHLLQAIGTLPRLHGNDGRTEQPLRGGVMCVMKCCKPPQTDATLPLGQAGEPHLIVQQAPLIKHEQAPVLHGSRAHERAAT